MANGYLEMPRSWVDCAVLALILAGTGLFSEVARAEFFGRNDKISTHMISSTSGHSTDANVRYTHEFAAQAARPRVTIYPRRTKLSSNSVRQCRATLVKEYRISGTVVVPRMICWWE